MRVLIVLTVILMLPGCALFRGNNDTEFSCPGYKKGLPCRDIRSVYRLTEGEDWQQAMANETGRAGEASGYQASAGQGSHRVPAIRPIDGSVPIMQPAVPLRVWIAPRQTVDGDLVWSSYIYTEIRPRKWAFGEEQVRDSKVLTPLQVNH